MGRDLVVSRYSIPTGILHIDGLSMGPSGFEVSQEGRTSFLTIREDPNSPLMGRLKSKLLSLSLFSFHIVHVEYFVLDC